MLEPLWVPIDIVVYGIYGICTYVEVVVVWRFKLMEHRNSHGNGSHDVSWSWTKDQRHLCPGRISRRLAMLLLGWMDLRELVFCKSQHRITKTQTVKAKEYGMRPPCAKFDKDAGKAKPQLALVWWWIAMVITWSHSTWDSCETPSQETTRRNTIPQRGEHRHQLFSMGKDWGRHLFSACGAGVIWCRSRRPRYQLTISIVSQPSSICYGQPRCACSSKWDRLWVDIAVGSPRDGVALRAIPFPLTQHEDGPVAEHDSQLPATT